MKQPNPDRLVVMLRKMMFKWKRRLWTSFIPWNSHDGALSWRVPPRLIIGGENAHVAAPHKVIVVEAKQGVGRGKKLGMEHYLIFKITTFLNKELSAKSNNFTLTRSVLRLYSWHLFKDAILHKAPQKREIYLRIEESTGSCWSLTTLWVVMGGGQES